MYNYKPEKSKIASFNPPAAATADRLTHASSALSDSLPKSNTKLGLKNSKKNLNSYMYELTTIFFLILFLLRENLFFRLLFLALIQAESNAQFIVNFVGLKI